MNDAAATITIAIEGMSCAGCVKGVRDALAGVPGVVVLDVQIGRAVISGAEQSGADALRALDRAGFDGSVVTRSRA